MSLIFGADCKIHPITDMPLENGSGALSHDEQAMIHCAVIEQQQGKTAGDAMREKVRAWLAGEQEGATEAEIELTQHQEN